MFLDRPRHEQHDREAAGEHADTAEAAGAAARRELAAASARLRVRRRDHQVLRGAAGQRRPHQRLLAPGR